MGSAVYGSILEGWNVGKVSSLERARSKGADDEVESQGAHRLGF